MATGQNSYNCQEDSDYPVADSYIYSQDHIVNRQEEAINIIDRDENGRFKKGHKHTEEIQKKITESLKGKVPWNKGKHHTEASKRKNSEAHKGKYDGTKNPFHGKHHTEESKLKNSQAHLGQMPWNKGKRGYYKTSEETKRRQSEALRGEKSYAWKGGISFEPYCQKFNDILKEKIRERDNRTCQLCKTKENGIKLCCHHIHYDKPNCDPDLIALCMRCNPKVNHNRDYWEEYFMNILRERGLVRT